VPAATADVSVKLPEKPPVGGIGSGLFVASVTVSVDGTGVGVVGGVSVLKTEGVEGPPGMLDDWQPISKTIAAPSTSGALRNHLMCMARTLRAQESANTVQPGRKRSVKGFEQMSDAVFFVPLVPIQG
jgi:hypothetical protein